MKNFDKQISKWIYDRAHASPVLTLLAKFGATYVIGLMVLVAMLFLWQSSYTSANPMDSIQPFLITIGLSWIITLALQFIVRRKRPFECAIYEAKVKMFCKTPSFPSAHATITFATASYFFNHFLFGYFDRAFLFASIFFFLVAIWIALSRVAVGVHYVSDIVVGALIGLLTPWLFVLLLVLSCTFTTNCI